MNYISFDVFRLNSCGLEYAKSSTIGLSDQGLKIVGILPHNSLIVFKDQESIDSLISHLKKLKKGIK